MPAFLRIPVFLIHGNTANNEDSASMEIIISLDIIQSYLRLISQFVYSRQNISLAFCHA